MTSMFQDLRYAARMFRKNKAHTAAAILPLAIGVGAATALFSVVYAVLLDPFPFADADRIVNSFFIDKNGSPRPTFLTAQQLVELRKADVIEDAIALDNWTMTLTGDDLPETVQTNYYSSNGPEFLGLTAALGRMFTDADGPLGREPGRVVVLTNRFWQSHFGGQRDVIGKTVQLNREPYTIIGVAAPRFDAHLADVIVPLYLKLDPHFAWGAQARLKPGVSRSVAEASLGALLEQFRKEAPTRYPGELRVKVSTLLDVRRTAGSIPTLLSLFAATALLLLVACANVSVLLLARGTVRRRELAVRHAIGASRRRLFGQLLVESAVLAMAGATLGAGLAYLSLPAVLQWLPPGALPASPAAIQINLPVLLISMAAATMTGVLFGLWPALSFSGSPAGSLVAVTRVAGSRAQRRSHQILMASQVALTVLLLVGTGAAIRGLLNIYKTQLNYDPANVLIATADLAEDTYMNWADRAAFFERVRTAIDGIPEVESAGISVYTGTPPRFGERFPVEIPGPASIENDFTSVVRSGPDFLSTLKIPLLRGRVWSAAENSRAAHVAVINEAMARRFWPSDDPVGQRVRISAFAASNSQFVLAAPGSDGWFEVVGVARNVPNAGLREPVTPSMYIPYTLMLGDSATFVMRTRLEPMSLVRAVREQMRGVDPHQAFRVVRTGESVLAQQGWARERFVAILLMCLAGIALLVALFGLYSVVSYSVSNRVREFGIRIAIGARRSDVLWAAMASPMASIACGLALGIVLSLVLNRALAQWSIGNLSDPVVLVLISVVFPTLTLAAALIPGRHATSVDPGTALRSE